jgi:diguanylate cyclase (GGDEF)-like protein
MANKTFLNFFGFNSLAQLHEADIHLCEHFIKDDEHFSCSDESNWIKDIVNLEKMHRIVLLEDKNNQQRIFEISVTSFTYETFHYVVSFNDITELKQYTYELQYKATHDNLTKLFNRQKFNDDLKHEILRVQRYGHTLSLFMFDIDDFKSVNDTYGHDVGDYVLIKISEIILDTIRKTDITARWGGEEFMVLLPETNIGGCMKIAQNVRKNVEEFHFEGIDRSITISIGAIEYNEQSDRDTLIKNVDIALYEAKHNGKNQVVKYVEK